MPTFRSYSGHKFLLYGGKGHKQTKKYDLFYSKLVAEIYQFERSMMLERQRKGI